MEIGPDYLARLARKAAAMGEDYGQILEEARDLFPSTKEFALPGILRRYLEARSVSLDMAFFLDVFLPMAAMGMALTTSRWTRMFLAMVVYMTGYYYVAILLAATAVVSVLFTAIRPRPLDRRETVIENGRLSIVGLTAVAVAATVGLTYWQPGPVVIFLAATIAGFLAILTALPTIQYHGAPDVAKMLLTVLLFGGVLYLVASLDVDRDQLYLLMKTGTPTYHIPRQERQDAVKLDQVYQMAKYYSRYPRSLRSRFTVEEGIWGWEEGSEPSDTADYMMVALHLVLFGMGFFTVLTDTGDTDRVLGDIKMRVLEKIKTTDLFGDTTLAKISMAMARIEWLVVVAANLVHTHWSLGLPGVALETILCLVSSVPVYYLWRSTVGIMTSLKGTNAHRQVGTESLPAPTIRSVQGNYMSGLASILAVGTLAVNLYYYLTGVGPYHLAASVLAFSACIVMVQNAEMLMGYKVLVVLAYTLNSPALLLIGSLCKRYQGRVMWSRVT